MTVTGEHGQPLPFAGTGQIYFLGLMHGHWRVPKEALAREGVEVAEAVNMGVSIVVPAHKILEILYQPELVKMRKDIDKEISLETGPITDSELAKPDATFTQANFEKALKKASRKVAPRSTSRAPKSR
jgi:hypothetical protein